MPFIVENSTGVTGANSYASVADLQAYAEFRLDLSDYTTQQMQSALVVASSDWVDGQHTFSGEPLNTSQGLDFPLVGIGLPGDIKNAAMQAALLQLQGLLLVDLSAVASGKEVLSESKSLGPLSKSVTYAKSVSQVYSRVLPVSLTNLLKPYLYQSGGQMVYRV